jgi:hypothetical protein
MQGGPRLSLETLSTPRTAVHNDHTRTIQDGHPLIPDSPWRNNLTKEGDKCLHLI